jgi:hypothetical protein
MNKNYDPEDLYAWPSYLPVDKGLVIAKSSADCDFLGSDNNNNEDEDLPSDVGQSIGKNRLKRSEIGPCLTSITLMLLPCDLRSLQYIVKQH